MRNEKPLILKLILMPFSFLYGLVVGIRNCLFNWKILPSEHFDVSVISVGNITVGGTGKTPFTEYLIKVLKTDNRVAVLSRGYKRESKGYKVLTLNSTPKEVGDEPYQIKQKFPDIMVAVDANRRRAIHNMIAEKKGKPEIIILDDAFQHRYVTPDISILLIDYNRMITEDYLLPVGELREPLSAKNRANILIVTKCPQNVSPIEFRIIRKKLHIFPYQSLYFTTLVYGDMIPLFSNKVNCRVRKTDLRRNYSVLLLTGIASPLPFEKHIQEFSNEVVPLNFPDHHSFSLNDMKEIKNSFDAIANKNKVIITTEKDAVRLIDNPDFPESLKKNIYYVPLSISFLRDEADVFDKKIWNFLDKNKYFAHLIS